MADRLAYIGLKYTWLELLASERGPSDASTRHVLHVLALHMKKQGGDCFPSQARIARRTGLSERAVRHHLKLAEESGWLTVRSMKRPGKRAWYVHEYTPAIPDAAQAVLRKTRGRKLPPQLRPAESAASLADERPAESAGSSESPNDRQMVPERPAICAGNDRQNLPPNLLKEPLTEHPRDRKPVFGGVVRNMVRTPESEASKAARIAKALVQLPNYTNADLAKVVGVTVDDVQRVRVQ